MVDTTVKTSLLIPSQLPEWIRDDSNYNTFVQFLQAYYQWMEESGNTLDYAKNIPNYMDIDSTTNQFMDYFSNDFLQYFPQDLLISKSQTIKLAKELYQEKGTPSSFKLLFKILYNSDFDVEYNKDFVFKASSGTWFSLKSVRLLTTDPNFLNIANYRLFGSISKSIATVENSVRSGNKIEVFVSNIERLFQSGETITVVDNNNQPVMIGGEILTATIVGQISQINMNPKNKGLLYESGDPVAIYGGLNPNIVNPIAAKAEVGTTTTGAIQNINVVNGGVGYSLFPNTYINIIGGNGANAVVSSVNPDPKYTSNVNVVTDTISFKQSLKIGANNFHFANIATSNANTKLINAFSFYNFSTYPISSVILLNGGGNITTVPQIEAESSYTGDNGTIENLYNQGILGPIIISNGGIGYNKNDVIRFIGGQGEGANAVVSNVSSNGSITAVQYVPSAGYMLGGMGYVSDGIPTLNVSSSNTHAYGASLYVSGILGGSAVFSASVTDVGAIDTINIIDPGEDYVSVPYISLKVEDILVSNTIHTNLPQTGDIVYQGENIETATYKANVYDTFLVKGEYPETSSIYSLRVSDYTTQPNTNLPLIINNKNIILKMANTAYAAGSLYTGSPEFNANGIKIYGDGKALASASFLNGLTISQGQYLDTSGQPSSFSVLQSDVYNNFTYKIIVQKEIAKYRKILLDLLHPAGMKVIGQYSLKSNSDFNMSVNQALFTGKSLQSYTGDGSSSVSMVTDFTNHANTVITFNNIPTGTNLSSFIITGIVGQPNTYISIVSPNGPNIKSEIIHVDNANNKATLATKTWLTYANVAYFYANTGINEINITSITNSYDYINNGNYSDDTYPLKDIVFVGDIVNVNGSSYTVQSVDYVDGIIYTTTNITSNVSSGLLSVRRSLNTTGVTLYGATGIEYTPELTTEDDISLTTENNLTIIVD